MTTSKKRIKRHLQEASVRARSVAGALEEDEGKIKLVDDFRSLADHIDECIQELEDL